MLHAGAFRMLTGLVEFYTQMERPTAPEPPSGDAKTPLSFSLNQAAALCGVSAHELWEWTACGYVNTIGLGDGRRYDREALRQILALRETSQSNREHGTRIEPFGGAPAVPEMGSARASEFDIPATAMDDAHLTLQTDLYFALNAGAGISAEDIAHYFGVDMEQMLRVLDSMVQTRHLSRILQASGVVFKSPRVRLRGPSVREQRIRATRRSRVPSRPL